MYLFQPKKAGNLDCTFCLDCIKACPHDNVAVLASAPASTLLNDAYRSSIGRLSKRTDLAALTLLIVFGAFANAAGMVAPVMAWEHRWHARLGAGMMPAIAAAWIVAGAVLLPALAVLLCGAVNRLTGSGLNIADGARRFAFALVPVGVAMWAAHLLYHFVTAWGAPIASAGRMIASGATAFAVPFVPGWLTSVQILLLDCGLLLTLYLCWRIAKQYADRVPKSLGMAAPWAALSCVLYAAGVWILLQPMQMRGMMH